MIIKKNRHGWIRIAEAFVAILLITSVLLIVINNGCVGKKDISLKVYKVEFSILREIQTDNELRDGVLEAGEPPIKWDDDNFPLNVKNKILNRAPNYLSCEAKICKIEDDCVLDKEIKEEVYAQPGIITANLEIYDPRQLKLFCWIKEPEEPVPEKPRAIVSLVFSDVVHELKYDVEIEGVVYPEVHYYYHTRTFEESNEVGVSLTEYQICYKDETCDPKGEIPPEHIIRIEASSLLVHEGRKFWTGYSEDSFTLKYWGTDDNGYNVYIEQHMCVQETNFEENCGVG